MRFRVLGPVEIESDDGQLHVLRRRQERCVLAILLLHTDQVVSVDRLCRLLWDDNAPEQARRAVHAHIARIRAMLSTAGAGRAGVQLLSRSTGYQLQADPDTIDAHRFRRLLDQVVRTADLDTRDRLLREALALWRGPALDKAAVSDRQRQRLCAHLDEQRLQAVEASMAAGLQLGRHRELMPELTRVAAEHPVRERLVELHMLALYRSGRTAEALDVFHHARTRLADELGLDPGPALWQLHRAILRGEPIPDPVPPPMTRSASAPVPPAQLPPDQAGFVGRAGELAELDGLLADGHTVAGAAVVISAVSGTAGVGKTALAVRWAHRARHLFPDGQLYVNLRGYAQAPAVRPIDVLAGFLSALGVPAERAPADVDQAANLYRSLLADRRMLVLLDNAASADQVRPLLPAAVGCFAVVTSRDSLNGLVARDGAYPLNLDILTPEDAHTLLCTILGAARVGAEPEATAALAQACAYLPLALRIAAANLRKAPDRPISAYVEELRTGDRLSALSIDGDADTAVRATFDLSYAALRTDARRLFRLLGLVPGPDVTADSAAALTGIPTTDAAVLLDSLVCAHLLTDPIAGRYACHDLLRRYAVEQAERHDSAAERATALHRLHDHYLSRVRAAVDLLRPDTLRLPARPADAIEQVAFESRAAASAWLDAERPNLVAAIVAAADTDLRRSAWQLTDALRGYFWLRAHVADWLSVGHAGITAARGDGDPRAEAAAELSLGDALHSHGRYREAISHHERALALAAQTGWLEGQATVLNNLGTVHQRIGQLTDAVEHYRQALAIRRRLGDRSGPAGPLLNLGTVTSLMGDFAGSAEYAAEAVAIFDSIGSHQGLGLALTNLGEVCHNEARVATAREHLTRALAVMREVGHPGLEATTLAHLAEVDLDIGDCQQSLDRVRAALAATENLSDSRYEPGVLNAAGRVYQRLGRPAEAIAYHERALDLSRQREARQPEIRALVGLAHAHADLLHTTLAGSYASEALALARAAGYRWHEGQALTALAEVELIDGDSDAAVRHARRAQQIHQQGGHRLDEAHSRTLIDRALASGYSGRRPRQYTLAAYPPAPTPATRRGVQR